MIGRQLLDLVHGAGEPGPGDEGAASTIPPDGPAARRPSAALGATVTGRPARLGSARHGTPWSERDGTIDQPDVRREVERPEQPVVEGGGRVDGRIQPALSVGPGQAHQGGQQRRQVAGGVRGTQRVERQRPAGAADDGMEHTVALEQLDEDTTVEAGGQVGGTQPARTAEAGAGPGPAAIAQLLLGGPESAAEAHELPRPGVRLAQLHVEGPDVPDRTSPGGVGAGPGRGAGQRPGPPAVGPA